MQMISTQSGLLVNDSLLINPTLEISVVVLCVIGVGQLTLVFGLVFGCESSCQLCCLSRQTVITI